MADPSKNLADAIDEYCKSWLLQPGDIKEGRLPRSSAADLIWERFREHRVCKVVGPPRSGKTYLAFSVGLDILGGFHNQPFRKVRYLDLASLKDVDDVDDILGEMDGHWLLIIDNCHLAADCHVRLAHLLQNGLKQVGLLLIETRFPQEHIEGLPAPARLSLLLELGQDGADQPLDAGLFIVEVAHKMLEAHVQKSLKLDAGLTGEALIARAQEAGGHFDAQDYESALQAATEFKTLKGNLRFLSWRLDVWKPAEGHLRELSTQAVLETVKHVLADPSRRYIGDLEKIAALAQWELPYSRPAGSNPSEGIMALEKKNIIALKGPNAWQMDATDAHLLMMANFGPEWREKSLMLIRGYLAQFPEQTPPTIRNLLVQAKVGVRTVIVAGLLATPALRQVERAYIARLVQQEQFDFHYLTSLAACLRYKQGKDQDDAALAGLTRELLPDELMPAIGARALTAGIASVSWFAHFIRKLDPQTNVPLKRFFDGYGNDNLVKTMSEAGSLAYCQAIANTLLADRPRFTAVMSRLSMETIGAHARGDSLVTVIFFLQCLKKLGAGSDELIQRFLDGYGREHLVQALSACKSVVNCQGLIKYLASDRPSFVAVMSHLPMETMGEHARKVNLINLSFFLQSIRKLGPDSDELIRRFFDGYGTEHLVQALSASPLTISHTLVNILLVDPPRFAAVMARLPMETMGERARQVSLIKFIFLLKSIKKLGPGSGALTRRFLDGYGREHLVQGFQACRSWTNRDTILKLVRNEPELFAKLGEIDRAIPVSLEDSSLKAFATFLWLAGSQSGARREKAIAMLADVDEAALQGRLQGETKPAALLAGLLNAAAWLDQAQTARLAGLVPRLWRNLAAPGPGGTGDSALELGYLLKNCWLASQQAGQELLGAYLATPATSQVPLARATGICLYLRTLELVAGGTVARLYAEQDDYFLQICEAGTPAEVDELLLILAVLAPGVIERMLARQRERAQRVLFAGSPGVGGWVRHVVARLYGVAPQGRPALETPSPGDTRGRNPAETIAAVIGLSAELGSTAAGAFADSLSTLRGTSSWIPTQLGREKAALAPGQVVKMLYPVFMSAHPPRRNSLDYVVILFLAIKSLTWSTIDSLDPNNSVHRTLETALHEGILRLAVYDEVITVALNTAHPFVREMSEIARKLLAPLQASSLTIQEWDEALAAADRAQADYYRSKLLAAGLVKWTARQEAGQLQILFTGVANPDKERLRAAICPSTPAA